MALAPGARLGPYEIIAAIGAGGMGEVYRARDTKLDRDVAIKVLPELFVSNPERVARFQREAKTLAALNHPHIGGIYGLEDAGGMHALVLELVEGPTLADRIAQGPIPLDEALPIARQIAEALEAAHDAGIIHRDLKPANIKLRPDGTVKVLDFGLAKALEPTSGASASVTASPTITTPAMMTGVGMILGTAAYMSPEQAKGRPADRRSDVWAFGCVLYEMLTGRRAFAGEDLSDTLAAVLRSEPDWTALPPLTPPQVRALIAWCLEKDGKARIADISTARFLVSERSISSFQVQPPRTPQQLWQRRGTLAAVVVAVVATIGAVAAWRPRASSNESNAVTRFSIALGEGQQFTASGERSIAMSSDGTQLVYVANGQLYLRSMSEEEDRPITGTRPVRFGVTGPVFSPDGRSVAFWSAADRTLKRVAVTGGSALTICPATNPFGMSWTADGLVFSQGQRGIFRVSAEGGAPEHLAAVKSGDVASEPQVLPGGRGLLFSVASGERTDPSYWDKARIVVLASKATEPVTIIEGGSDAQYLPTGHIVYVREGRLLAVSFDLGALKVTSTPVAVIEGIARSFSVSNNGSLAYLRGPVSGRSLPQFSLALLDEDGHVERLKLPPGPYELPRVSPDGKQIAFSTVGDDDTNVWLYDLTATSERRQLTFGGRNRFPVWAPDGRYVAFQSDRDGDRAIFRQRADVSGPPAERLTTPEPGTAHIPESWSRDGFLSFSVEKASRFSLCILSLKDQRQLPVEDTESTAPLGSGFSPDGRQIAYQTDEAARGLARGTAFVRPFPITGEKNMIGERRNAYHPAWLRDGRLSYSQGLDPGPQWVVVNLRTQPIFAVGTPRALSNGGLVDSVQSRPRGESERNFDFTQDGKRIGLLPDETTWQRTGPIRVVLNWFTELKQRVPTK